jgi:hypothetical protein
VPDDLPGDIADLTAPIAGAPPQPVEGGDGIEFLGAS